MREARMRDETPALVPAKEVIVEDRLTTAARELGFNQEDGRIERPQMPRAEAERSRSPVYSPPDREGGAPESGRFGPARVAPRFRTVDQRPAAPTPEQLSEEQLKSVSQQYVNQLLRIEQKLLFARDKAEEPLASITGREKQPLDAPAAFQPDQYRWAYPAIGRLLNEIETIADAVVAQAEELYERA